jgi:hypothetical protein
MHYTFGGYMADAPSSSQTVGQINNIVIDSWRLFWSLKLRAVICAIALLVTFLVMMLPIFLPVFKNIVMMIMYLILVFLIPSFVWGDYLLRIYHLYNAGKVISKNDLHIFMVARLLHLYPAFLFVFGFTEMIYLLINVFPLVCFVGYAAVLPTLAYAVMGDHIIKALKRGFDIFWRNPLVVLCVLVLPFFIMLAPMVILLNLDLPHLSHILGYALYVFALLWMGFIIPWNFAVTLVLQKNFDPEAVTDYLAKNVIDDN